MSMWKEIELKLKYFFGSIFYLKYTPYAYIYSWKRDRLEREFTFVTTEEGFDKPGKLLSAEQGQNITKFYFEFAELEICFLAEDLVRIEWKLGLSPIPYGIAKQEWQEVETQLEQAEDSYFVFSNQLKVIIAGDGSLKFCNASGQVLREESRKYLTNGGR